MAHTLKVETAAWDSRNALLRDCCSCDELQDEAHALLVCRDADVCTLRRKYAYLFFSGDFSMKQPYLQQANGQAVYDFLCKLQHNNLKLFSLVSELMDIMLTGSHRHVTETWPSARRATARRRSPDRILVARVEIKMPSIGGSRWEALSLMHAAKRQA
eukprot:1143742-Pelagomonas_calceolata.AAC.3